MGMAICFPSSTFGYGVVACPIKFGARHVGEAVSFPASVIQSSVIIDFLQVPLKSGEKNQEENNVHDTCFLRCKHTVQGGPLYNQGTMAQGRFRVSPNLRTYFQLTAEDYNWWWRSFLSCHLDFFGYGAGFLLRGKLSVSASSGGIESAKENEQSAVLYFFFGTVILDSIWAKNIHEHVTLTIPSPFDRKPLENELVPSAEEVHI